MTDGDRDHGHARPGPYGRGVLLLVLLAAAVAGLCVGCALAAVLSPAGAGIDLWR